MLKILKKLNTPSRIQDFLDTLPFNFEERGETYRSPKSVLKYSKAHCFEGALLAAACLHTNGRKALLLDLKTKDIKKDADHVVALFKENGLWGAISKTNHAVLRYRDPIYRTVRELALSYFHEYFLASGEKTLVSFSKPFDIVKKFGQDWIESDEDLDEIAEALDKSPHTRIYNTKQAKSIRLASKFEVLATSREEWRRGKKAKK